MKSHLFFLTKLILYIDTTTYILDIAIKLHLSFKYK